VTIIELSSRSGEHFDRWLDLLRERVNTLRDRMHPVENR
jgi:hypothetical protein